MALIRVKRHHQITIPSVLCKKLKIDVGDYVEIENHNSEIIMRPVKMVHPDQEYFFTKEWQKGEAQADEDIALGDVVGPFEDPKDALRALKKAKI